MTTATTTTTIEQMVANANATIEPLQSNLTSLAERLETACAELATIEQARDEWARQMEISQAYCAKLLSEQELAIGYAQIAHGTPNEVRAMKDMAAAIKAHEKAKKELAKLEREQIEGGRQAHIRETELLTLVAQLKREHHSTEDELRKMLAAREQVYAELGQERYQAVIAGYHEREALVASRLAALVEVKSALQAYQTESLESLKDWPELQHEVERLMIPDDSVVRTLKAHITYLDALIEELYQLPNTLPKDFVRRGIDLWTLIVTHHEMIYAARRYTTQMPFLKAHRDLVEGVLQEYQAHLEQ